MHSAGVVLQHFLSRFSLQSLSANTAHALLFAAISFFVIFAAEAYYRAPIGRYWSRSFLHDMLYWLYYFSGLHTLLFTGLLYVVLGRYLKVFNLGLLNSWPGWARYLAYFVVTDFCAYWFHRWKHASPFLWAFHSVHHSQETLTPPTIVRAHPVEQILGALLIFIPLQIMGAPPELWFPIMVVRNILEWTQHSELPWKLGPFYWIIISPKFHAFHHSVQPEHHDKNFGTNLAIWDFIFGTAIEEKERPGSYGLPDLKMPSLASQVWQPFRMAWEAWAGEPRTEGITVNSTAPAPERSTV